MARTAHRPHTQRRCRRRGIVVMLRLRSPPTLHEEWAMRRWFDKKCDRYKGHPDTVECEGFGSCGPKMPKNAHAHFMLGLMYQRLGQAQKVNLSLEKLKLLSVYVKAQVAAETFQAIASYEKSTEILLQDEEEVRRPDLLSSCILQASMGDSFDEELETGEVDDILAKLKSSVESDHRQAAVWNILGLVLLRGGQIQWGSRAVCKVLSRTSSKRPKPPTAALVNYAVLLLCRYGSLGRGQCQHRPLPASERSLSCCKECLLAAVKADPRAASVWVNLANAYYMDGEHRNSKRCLEQAAKLEPNHMPARYAIAAHRIRDAVRSQCSNDQLLWAANEMATVLKKEILLQLMPQLHGLGWQWLIGHNMKLQPPTIPKNINLNDAEERAQYTLKQAIQEDPDDAVPMASTWLCTIFA
ncbi:unnamed protein product [Miscanthus lutarioriparius]|uniref:Uncharacterized protein n=1 Tax=Miscanthus lutarioriparius TaxID=422564 RepID=A0A811SQU3_9POAL|nr:unnamed protein product [Miscanthus lutarioriparius]